MSRGSRMVLLAALAGGALLVGVELMVTAVALPAIVADLADWTQLPRASWIVNGYLLAYIATMPLAGRAADRYRIPPLFAAGLLLFAAGSLLAGAAQDLDWLIAARVVQGVGAGAVVPLATAAASHLFTGHARGRALGVVAACTFLGMALGPFAGAAVLVSFDLAPAFASAGVAAGVLDVAVPAWRWVFYLGAPIALVSLLVTWAAGGALPRPTAAGSEGRLDVLGASLFTAALAAGLLALTTLGEAGLTGPEPLALFGVAASAAVLAVLHARRARNPFLPLDALGDRVFLGAVLVSLLTGYALATAVVGAAVFVDRVRYGGPEEQQFALGSLAGAVALGALAAGFALRIVRIVPLSLVGLAFSAAGLIVLTSAGTRSSLDQFAMGLGLYGVGFGLTVTPRSVAAVEALGRSAFGLASAAVTVGRMVGMAIGLGVLTHLGSDRIEALSVVLVDAAARDAVLPEHLRGRPLEDGLVVDALELWASERAAEILAGLFLIAAVVTIVAVVPTLAMNERRGARARGGPTDVRREAEVSEARAAI